MSEGRYPDTVVVQVLSDGFLPEGWVVEAVDVDGEGGIDTTTFTGLNAEARARRYAAIEYGVSDGH